MIETSVAETRELRGLKLARERGEEIENEGRGWYRVPGCSGGSYRVHLAVLGGEEFCTCPDFGKHREPCKHVYAATIIRAKRQAEARRKDAARRESRPRFSPEQIAANLERMGG